jgi:hypothetical protein
VVVDDELTDDVCTLSRGQCIPSGSYDEIHPTSLVVGSGRYRESVMTPHP